MTIRTVPTEPTRKMINAAERYDEQLHPLADDGVIYRGIYKAMLAAAPAQPDPAADPVLLSKIKAERTPRTDAAIKGRGYDGTENVVTLCRQLERELAASQERAKELEALNKLLGNAGASLTDALDAAESAVKVAEADFAASQDRVKWLEDLVARTSKDKDEQLKRAEKAEQERDAAEERRMADRAELLSHREKAKDNYWAWQDDIAENYIESLVCPIMIQAEQMKVLLAERDALAKVLAELVRLKDIHDKLESKEALADQEFYSLHDDYSQNKLKAWEAARAISGRNA